MTKKWPLFIGVFLITAGVLIRILTKHTFDPILIMATGGLFKMFYIRNKIKNGEYKPGIEIPVLLAGLALFLSGIYLRSENSLFNPKYLIIPGLILKGIFIFMIIKKFKNAKKLKSE